MSDAPWISVTLRPLDGLPAPKMYERVLAVPRRGEVIVAREIAFEVRQVTHFALSHERGRPSIEILVEKVVQALRG